MTGACAARAGVRVAALLAVAAGGARAAEPGSRASPDTPAAATFALIIGVNASPEPRLAPLQYADDDAARYLDLFRALGARTYLLTRVDDNTRRLHAQAAAEAAPPRREELRRAVEALARDLAQARARGVPTILYLAYAGHGQVRDGIESLTLEDGPLTGSELLREVVARVGADQSHLLIDACNAHLLAFARGPGGQPRELHGFVELAAASQSGRVGYLLASSASGESHEWAGFQAGVFSHEVRSGLYGAADADGDGRVSYAEIAAFVTRANQVIANDRYRPQVLARAPAGNDTLLDLRARRDGGLRIGGELAAAHYQLEDQRGVRILDFHGSAGRAVHLLRPTSAGPLYLRREDDLSERVVLPAPGVVDVATVAPQPSGGQPRGAAHLAFSETFALPFDETTVAAWRLQAGAVEAELRAQEDRRQDAYHRARNLRIAGWGTAGLAAIAAAGASAAFLSAHGIHDQVHIVETQGAAAARNRDIDARNRLGMALVGGSLAAGVASAILFWRSTETGAPAKWSFGAGPGTAGLGAAWTF
jgi:hypothetical protein